MSQQFATGSIVTVDGEPCLHAADQRAWRADSYRARPVREILARQRLDEE